MRYFDETISILQTFKDNPNPWVQRSIGVAAHFFAKRVRNNPDKVKRVIALLSPYFEEKDNRIVKGIGWGFKTIGRYYPDLLTYYLKSQSGKNPSRTLLNKALTYLPEERKQEIRGK